MPTKPWLSVSSQPSRMLNALLTTIATPIPEWLLLEASTMELVFHNDETAEAASSQCSTNG
ncbi:hypothetical protein DEH84_14220 [Aquabacterium olei]|uniref:Uncharacterized protein n=1 Tax=Aquabacterium olei TaxID=1296669 RepID=A0A2U8FTR1_9BURK|nr:hypothetical protein DEH84_14220 [Aquabacterium olei]